MKRQKSLLLRLLTIVTITILAPSILTFLVFFPHSSGANGNTGTGKCRLYIDQTNASVKILWNWLEVAFSALGDPMLQKKHAENRILSEQYGTWRLGTDGRQRNSLSIRLEP